ncbi:hypothetical protein DFH27DRAFT_648645 [Peziza echinospora]|nr:hypothetical protein DFH27DRAFT_648645 [Peziza echinospora]
MPETRLTIPANHSSPIPTYYYHLKSTPSTDPITWRQHLTTSLTTLLGLQGTAITIDILKTTPSTGECIIRASGVDADRVGTAVGGGMWVGGMG